MSGPQESAISAFIFKSHTQTMVGGGWMRAYNPSTWEVKAKGYVEQPWLKQTKQNKEQQEK